MGIVPSDLDLHNHRSLGNSLNNNHSIHLFHNNLLYTLAWRQVCQSSGWPWSWAALARGSGNCRAPCRQRCCRSAGTGGHTARSCPPCNKGELLSWGLQEDKVVDMGPGKHRKDVCSSSKGSGVDQRLPEGSEEGVDAAGPAARWVALPEQWWQEGLWQLEHLEAVPTPAASRDSSGRTLAGLNLPLGAPQAGDGYPAPGYPPAAWS